MAEVGRRTVRIGAGRGNFERNCLAFGRDASGGADPCMESGEASGEVRLRFLRQAAGLSESEQRVAEEAYDICNGRAGLELHLDGVGQGDELALAIEIQGDDAFLDARDHGQRLIVPATDKRLRRGWRRPTQGPMAGRVAGRRRRVEEGDGGVRRRRAYGGRRGRGEGRSKRITRG